MDSAWVNQQVARRPAGEASSLEALIEQYAGRVYRLALNITRNSADAEEVVQDVFFAVFRKIDTFEGRCAFGTWLYRICINAALNKRRGKRFDLETSLEQLAQSHDGSIRAVEVARTPADWSQTPDRLLLTEEALAVLGTALDALPGHYRAVVILRDVEELPSADVAEVLQESEPCVKSRLHRARLILRERLAYYFPDRQRCSRVAVGVPGQRRREKHSSNRCPEHLWAIRAQGHRRQRRHPAGSTRRWPSSGRTPSSGARTAGCESSTVRLVSKPPHTQGVTL